jgi:hypothetical protein
LKQQIAEEQVVMLKHQLFCRTLPKSFDSLDRPLDDLDEKLRKKVIDKDIRTMITSRRHKVVGQLKLDMTTIYISTAEATARGHAKIAREEKEKLLSLTNNVVTTNDIDILMVNNVSIAIQARQEIIIKRAQYVTGCKVSFFEETPTLLME